MCIVLENCDSVGGHQESRDLLALIFSNETEQGPAVEVLVLILCSRTAVALHVWPVTGDESSEELQVM